VDVKALIKKFGGQTELSELLGIRQSAIAYWVKAGTVPSKWHERLLSIAQSRGLDVLATDLLAVNLRESNLGFKAAHSQFDGSGNNDHIPRSQNVALADQGGAEQFLFYASANGTIKVQVLIGDETVWASQKGMADIFDVSVPTINEHLTNIYEINELEPSTTIRNFRTVVDSGADYNVRFYNLDAVISVGYRVNSFKATQFRKWATTILREYLVKGFAMDDQRLKQGNQLFGKDYFEELLERIRRIRNSERMFWQKVTDLYSQCSVDYDQSSPITQTFFAHIQNKFHYAIHHNTAAELILKRADAAKPNMGMVHYSNMHKDGVILKSDVTTGKNYLTPEELDELERLVENYLGTAELFAKRKIVMTMKDWVQKLDEFMRFNAYDVLEGSGKVSSEIAKKHALAEYEKFRVENDKKFRSDFDRLVEDSRIKRKFTKPTL
jgi:hypothetical protein